jgi:hypothetical protein
MLVPLRNRSSSVIKVLWRPGGGAGTARPRPFRTSGARKSVVAVAGVECGASYSMSRYAPIATKFRSAAE